MTHHTIDYAAKMHERGYRVTPQRELILDAICASRGHITAEEIYEEVHAKAPAVNLATVYRTVGFLTKLRLVTEMHVSGKTYYEIVQQPPHHHLICRICGKEEQISHAAVKELFVKIEREQGFQVETNHLGLVGICKHCRQTA